MKGWLKYWRVLLALFTVFLAGGLLGFTAGSAVTKRKMQQLRPPGNWAGLMMRRLDHELNLTPEQRQQVMPLLRTAARDLYATRRQATLSGMQHLRTFYNSLEPILMAEQKQKLELAKERMKQRYKEGGENRPFGSGGPLHHPFSWPPRPQGKTNPEPGSPVQQPPSGA
jgi:hypothetical protein